MHACPVLSGARGSRALYAVMLSPEVGRGSKAPMFLSLLFKAMRADVSPKRACAFVKRLLQVACHQAPNFACGCLLLTSQLLQARAALPPSLLCMPPAAKPHLCSGQLLRAMTLKAGKCQLGFLKAQL